MLIEGPLDLEVSAMPLSIRRIYLREEGALSHHAKAQSASRTSLFFGAILLAIVAIITV